jgi:Amt family ammonium transporter
VLPAVPGTYDMAGQVWAQVKAVALALLWSGGISAVLFYFIDKAIGLRPSTEVEREGLDINEHGERAYNH